MSNQQNSEQAQKNMPGGMSVNGQMPQQYNMQGMPGGMPVNGQMPPQYNMQGMPGGMPVNGQMPPQYNMQGMPGGMPVNGQIPPQYNMQGMSSGMPVNGQMPPQYNMQGMPGGMPVNGQMPPQYNMQGMPGGMPVNGQMPQQYNMQGMPGGMPVNGQMPQQYNMQGMPGGMPVNGQMPPQYNMQGMPGGMPMNGQMPPQYNMQGMPTYNGQMPPYNNKNVNTVKTPKNKEKKNLESAVGKNLMGILASLLIFAGLILTVRATYEYLDDIARVIGLYAISGILLAAGMVGKKFNKNPFFLSLTGCGVGSIYISLFLTYSYFGMINMLVLYILLTVWSVIVYFLGGKGSQLFKIIGQVGILVSLIYGTIAINTNEIMQDVVMATFTLIIFYILVSIFYLLMERKTGVAANLPSLIINMFGSVFLLVAAYRLRGGVATELFGAFYDADVARQIILGVLNLLIESYVIFLLVLYVKRIDVVVEKANATIGWIFYAGFAVLRGAWIFELSDRESLWVGGIIGLLFYGAMLYIMSLRKRDDVAKILLTIFIYPFMVAGTMYLDVVTDIINVGILALTFSILGFFKKDKVYFIFGIISTYLFLFIRHEYPAAYAVLALLFIILITVFLLNGPALYSKTYKCLVYGALQIFILEMAYKLGDVTDFEYVTTYSFAYALSAIACGLETFTIFSREWIQFEKIEKGTRVFLAVINGCLMLWGCSILFWDYEPGIHVMNLIFVFGVFVMNIYPMIKYYPQKPFVGFYLGAKLTLYLVCALYSYEAEGYVVSLCCLIMAIACIIFGFVAKYKYIRFYGLILALLSIIKLVLFDITYDTTLARAITITVCGIIAFAISFVYSILDKKIEGNVKTEENDSKKSEQKINQPNGKNLNQGNGQQMMPNMNYGNGQQMMPNMNYGNGQQMMPNMNYGNGQQMVPNMNYGNGQQMMPNMNYGNGQQMVPNMNYGNGQQMMPNMYYGNGQQMMPNMYYGNGQQNIPNVIYANGQPIMMNMNYGNSQQNLDNKQETTDKKED